MKVESKTITRQVVTKITYDNNVEWEVRKPRDGESIQVINIETDQEYIDNLFNNLDMFTLVVSDDVVLTAVVEILDLNKGEINYAFLNDKGEIEYKE